MIRFRFRSDEIIGFVTSAGFPSVKTFFRYKKMIRSFGSKLLRKVKSKRMGGGTIVFRSSFNVTGAIEYIHIDI